MKIKILILSILLSYTHSVYSMPVSEKSHEQNCRGLMQMAEAVIIKKQEGRSLAYALSTADHMRNENPKNEHMDTILRGIIMDAYKQPTYSTPKIKQEQINEFSAKYYLACMEMYE